MKKRLLSLVLAVIMLLSGLSLVYAAGSLDSSDNATLISSKIDPELREIMDEADEDELIPVGFG